MLQAERQQGEEPSPVQVALKRLREDQAFEGK